MGKAQSTVLSPSELRDLKSDIAGEKSYLGEVTGTPPGSSEMHLPGASVANVDVGAIKNRISRKEKALHALGPDSHRISGRQRKEAEKEYSALKEWIQANMLTVQERDAFPSATDGLKDSIYRKAVEKIENPNGEMSRIFQTKAHRFKFLARVLWPEDEDAGNMDKIRPSGGSSGRHFGG